MANPSSHNVVLVATAILLSPATTEARGNHIPPSTPNGRRRDRRRKTQEARRKTLKWGTGGRKAASERCFDVNRVRTMIAASSKSRKSRGPSDAALPAPTVVRNAPPVPWNRTEFRGPGPGATDRDSSPLGPMGSDSDADETRGAPKSRRAPLLPAPPTHNLQPAILQGREETKGLPSCTWHFYEYRRRKRKSKVRVGTSNSESHLSVADAYVPYIRVRRQKWHALV